MCGYVKNYVCEEAYVNVLIYVGRLGKVAPAIGKNNDLDTLLSNMPITLGTKENLKRLRVVFRTQRQIP